MDGYFFSPLLIGSLLIIIGIRGTFYELGSIDSEQDGKRAIKRLLTSLVLTVWGLSIVLLAVVLRVIFQS